MENHSKSFPEEHFFYCFYHVLSLKHTNYHHVLIKTDDVELIKVLDTDHYQYRLISAQSVFLDEEDRGKLIIRGLIMDGESLLKRFKAQQTKSIQTT
jgi:hypothetical protein